MVMGKVTRSVLCFLTAVVMLAGLLSAGCGGSGQAIDFKSPGGFVFNPDVVTVGAGGDAFAELKALPKGPMWTAEYSDPRPNHGPEFHATAVSPDGSVVGVGSTSDLTSQVPALKGELLVGRYSQDGKPIAGWPRLYADTYAWNEGQDVAVDSQGNITVTGYSIGGNLWYASVWKFDPAGNPLPGWPRYTTGGSRAWTLGVIVDSSGETVSCGAAGNQMRETMLITRYAADGTAVAGWPKTYLAGGGQNLAYDLIQDTDGNFVIVGYTADAVTPNLNRDAVLWKIDSTGSVLAGWPKRWRSPGGSDDQYFSISQAANGDYCVVGLTGGTTEENGKLLVTRYNKSGQELKGWPKIYPEEGLRDASPPDSWRGSVDSANNIAAAFTTSGKMVKTVKYTPQGTLFAGFPKTAGKAGSMNVTRSCGVDGQDNIYTAGFSSVEANPTQGYPAWVTRYAPATYSTGNPSVAVKQGMTTTKLTGFGETLGPDNQGKVGYQLSPDGKAWYFYDKGKLTKVTSSSQYDTAAEMNGNIDDFDRDAGASEVFIKAILDSNGSQKVQLQSISLKYSN